MKSKIRLALLLGAMLGVALVLAGCASSGGADPAKLEGSWILTSFGGTTAPVPADPSVSSELTLQAGKASGSGGVNTFSGTYKASRSGKISFGPLAATAMAGPPAAMEQESKFFAALEKAERFEFNDGKLVLSDSGNNTLIVLAPK